VFGVIFWGKIGVLVNFGVFWVFHFSCFSKPCFLPCFLGVFDLFLRPFSLFLVFFTVLFSTYFSSVF